MSEIDLLTGPFEARRNQLRAVAYRMLGSLAEAEDAVQEAWLRASRADIGGVENLGSWLTTVVARVSLNMLRSRNARREQSLETHMPDPVVSPAEGGDPEHEALLADSIGLAMLVVLDTLTPAERVAFVLHDAFAVPFEEIASIAEVTPAAARQLASRARRKVQQAPVPNEDLSRQRSVVDAFFAAARNGDFDTLVAVLDPDDVLRSDGGSGRSVASAIIRGASEVASRAITFGVLSPAVHPALVNGAVGVVVAPHGRPVSVMGFIVRDGRIVAIDVLADPARLDGLGLSIL